MSGLNPAGTALAHVDAAAAELGQRLPFDVVMAVLWSHRRLELEIVLRRVAEAPRLFARGHVDDLVDQLGLAEAWSHWWQACAYGMALPLPGGHRG